MPLYDIRNRFIQASGRDDLGTVGDTSTGSDNGADEFINTGQKILDRMQDVDKANARYQKNVAVGAWYKHFRYCRAVHRVIMIRDTTTEDDAGWVPLEKVDDPVELLHYYNQAPAEITTGTPTHYAIWINNLSPEQDDIDSNDIEAEASRHNEDLLFYENEDDSVECQRTIIFLPPTDTAFTLMVIGKFESRELVVNADRSYWTENHPDLLVAAAQYALERYYRNSEGMRDHMLYIKEYLFGLAKDQVFEKIAENDFMRG